MTASSPLRWSLVLMVACALLSAHALSVAAGTLSHPDVVSLPLTRADGSYRKANARATAGNVHYQRFMSAMAYGAELNKVARGMNTMSVTPAPLAGCPFSDFTIPVTIGASTFQLLVDTGSSTLAIAGSTCTTCTGVTPLWAASSTTSASKGTTSGLYGDGSGWTGTIYSDTVTISTTAAVAVAPSATVKIVVITRQSQTGVDSDGTTDSSATTFFNANSCADISSTAILSQGIIGIAFEALASTGTDSTMAMIFSQNPTLPKVFALQMCENSGKLWVGGYDTTTYSGVLHYTPITTATYYVVAPTGMSIGGTALSLTTSDWGSEAHIVDSGTTLWELPSAVYTAVVTALLANTNFQKYFRHTSSSNFFDGKTTTCETVTSGSGGTWAVLQANLPVITLTMSNGLVLTMDGLGSYIMPCSNAYDQFTPGIASGTQMIGGWSFMNQFITVHDVANMRIGFAPSTSCTTGKVPSKAAVSGGTVDSVSSSSSTGTSSSTKSSSSSSTGSSKKSSSSSSSTGTTKKYSSSSSSTGAAGGDDTTSTTDDQTTGDSSTADSGDDASSGSGDDASSGDSGDDSSSGDSGDDGSSGDSGGDSSTGDDSGDASSTGLDDGGASVIAVSPLVFALALLASALLA